ncbi:Trimethylamine-N-oxide reductase precursor [Mannheimia haemolytica]|uniref:Trimethylamine-N-oxide reductase n=1 Tax=Mannheimia haemolytica TaxID=75985 RepID=A0A378MV71_MANHA|nr:Trimethylamine-N-oxide reductase precursor [Mannheimia haemolytica]
MYTVGFEKFLPYLLGENEDKVAKTPEWAAEICGISADKIREFARMLAGKRTQFIFGWAIQRQQHGEQPYWMGAVLASMLGQIGLEGGGISYAHHYSSIGIPESGAAMPGRSRSILMRGKPEIRQQRLQRLQRHHSGGSYDRQLAPRRRNH